jgi:hypothetical protein
MESRTYLDSTGRDDAWAGGVRMIPITTPKGEFRVWTKRVGNNPTIKLLLLYDDQATHRTGYQDETIGVQLPVTVDLVVGETEPSFAGDPPGWRPGAGSTRRGDDER